MKKLLVIVLGIIIGLLALFFMYSAKRQGKPIARFSNDTITLSFKIT